MLKLFIITEQLPKGPYVNDVMQGGSEGFFFMFPGVLYRMEEYHKAVGMKKARFLGRVENDINDVATMA